MGKNYFTANAGEWGLDGTWVGGATGTPGTNAGFNTGTADTIFVDHAVTTTSAFALSSSGGLLVVIIRSGGSLAIDAGASFTLGAAKLILDGGNVSASNTFTVNSSPSSILLKNSANMIVTSSTNISSVDSLSINATSTYTTGTSFTTSNDISVSITVNGKLNAGSLTGIASTWNIGSSGTLDVSPGDFANNNSGMNFTNCGKVNVAGNTQFHSGNYTTCATGSFTSNGSGEILFGAANITNDGVMNFPNATGSTTYNNKGFAFDCDGASGGGSVGFGAGAFCSVCTSSSGSNCVDNGVALPIELNYFTVHIENEEFVFNWETLTEDNNDFFTIEYSFDLKEFESLLEEEGSGTSLSPINYERAVAVFPFENIIYFRLKQTDFDGNYSYSKIEALSNSALKTVGLSIYPNPTKGKTLIKLEKTNETPLTVFVLSPSTLQVVHTFQIENGEAVVDLTNVEEGVYFLKVEHMSSWFKLVVQ